MKSPVQFLGAAILCIVTACQAPAQLSTERNQDADGLKFIQLCDTQLGFSDKRARKNASDPDAYTDQHMDLQTFERVVGYINGMKPAAEFVIVCGDMVNDATDRQQLQNYSSTINKLNIPHHECPGNHDAWNEHTLKLYRERQADYYMFTHRGVDFIALNSMFLVKPDELPEETKKQNQFILDSLQKNPTHPKFLFMHFPLFTETHDEADHYFNVPPTQRSFLLNAAKEHGVVAILAGHFHRNAIRDYAGIAMLTSGPISEPMGVDQDGQPASRGLRIINYYPTTGKLEHEYMKAASIP